MAGLTKIKSGGISPGCDLDGSGTLKLDSTNNRVGVGTTTPSHKFQILHDNTAALKVGGNGGHVDGYHLELGQLATSSSAGIKYTGSGGSMTFDNSSSEVARFRPDGQLCMGTTSATASRNLTLTGLTNDAGIQINGKTSGGNCYITNTPGSSAATYIGNTNSRNLNFVVGGNVSSKMTIDSAGHVGIGDSDPTCNLHVTGSNNYANNTSSLSEVATKSPVRIQGSNNSSTSLYIGSENNDSDIYLQVANENGSATDVLQLQPYGGSVGIGCNPVRDLQLHASDASSELMISNSTTGATAGSGFMIQQDGNDTYIWNKENSFMSFGTNADGKMRLANSGELLLGTTTAPGVGELLKVEKKSAGTEGSGIRLSGTYSLVDEGSISFTVGNCALIFIAENNTGDGAMFFCTFKASAVSKVSDPHDRYANSDTDGKICVFKTANSQSVVLKNRCGATKSFTIGKINTSD